jgi:hypothetical protein
MRYALAVVLSLAVAVPAQAGDKQKEKKSTSSVPIKGTAENGPDVKKSVSDLTTKISWQSSLDAAMELARKERKMIFWMNMLGDLNGST